MYKRIFDVFFLMMLLFPAMLFAQSARTKILFIPLDDRPPCLQFTQRIGLIGNAELVTPPKELLGKFLTAGNSEGILSWMKQQDLKSFQAAIISIDMLVYGGLVASRVHKIEVAKALDRMKAIEELHKRAPALPVYAQNVIMRLAPTADGKNGAYRAELAEWAEISVSSDPALKLKTAELAARIPGEAITDYLAARRRNLSVNKKALEYIKSGVLRYLIFSQDDARPAGIHVADRQQLVSAVKTNSLSAKVAVQPGADEVSMLLLAKALNDKYKISPRIMAVYSSASAAAAVMPFEDKPLNETVSFHIKATGSTEVKTENDADLLFYVFASRRDAGRAVSFANEIEMQIQKGKRIILADIDPVGDVQGGDSIFTRELERRGLLSELNSYASWNTAANTIGTTLPQGVVFYLATQKLLKDKSLAAGIWTAQNWFTFHRVLDDYYFHGLQRLKINKHFAQEKSSSKILSDSLNTAVEKYALTLMQESFNSLSNYYFKKRTGSSQLHIDCAKPDGLNFSLPWNRTFEAEIDFGLSCAVKD